MRPARVGGDRGLDEIRDVGADLDHILAEELHQVRDQPLPGLTEQLPDGRLADPPVVTAREPGHPDESSVALEPCGLRGSLGSWS